MRSLAEWLGLQESELRDWLGGRPPEPRGREYHYTSFTIPKRTQGFRTIEAPSDPLKALQRRILHRLLNPVPVHYAARGFVLGKSIVHNARAHAGRGVVINLDLADFFPSIRAEKVLKTFRALGWNREAAQILTHICTQGGHLPQGAPTSPALSNLVCRRMDTRLTALVKTAAGGRYTRYADDITISFPRFGRNRRPRRQKSNAVKKRAPWRRAASRVLLYAIRAILENEGFQIQMKKKVRVQREHQRQMVTGLVVNRVVNLPREARRRLRAMQHRERQGALDEAGKRRLRGLEALQHMVEAQRQLPGAGKPPREQ